ncbi:hypothetical protein GGU11DRAFT_763895 [Lentinula aff. detonsa]|nr:hypothetical protein GGU11DRAFT_763895 [Lentinula aff. detonsa]
MCRYRQVQNTYSRCGHVIREPDELVRTCISERKRISHSHTRFAQIPCADRFCKFSAYHPPDCGPNCSKTCWQ